SVNADTIAGGASPAHHPVRDRGVEQLRVILDRDSQGLGIFGDLVKCCGECRTIGARRHLSALIGTGPRDRFPMARCKPDEILGAGQGGNGFKRVDRRRDAAKEPLSFVKFGGAERRARFAVVNVRGFATPEPGKLAPKAREGRNETSRTRTWTRA